MKDLIGMAEIFGCLFLGAVLHALLPLPIPDTIYGMVILLAALHSGLIKLDQIDPSAQALLKHLAFYFVVPGVALMNQGSGLKKILLPLLTVSTLTTFLVMAVTALVISAVQKMTKEKGRRVHERSF